MIDLLLLREHPDNVVELIQRKDPSFDGKKLVALERQVREIQVGVEKLRSERNELSKQGGKGITDELRQRAITLGKEIKEQEQLLETVQVEFRNLYLSCPNIPEESIPLGNKESNKVVKTFGEKPHFTFAPKHHLDLGNALGWFDFEAATVMTGGGFALYKGDSVKLMYALTMFMLKNNIKHGFTPVIPPYVINEKSLEVASNFPKFRDQVYAINDDGLFLSPTSEVNLTNMYRDHILAAEQLPIRMTAWTSCFRREAGGYGAHERGLIRIHEFEKVELYAITTPEESDKELSRILACAEDILQQLGLHYRVSLLAAQDCSFASAKTFDIEVWLPGQGTYYEVSSCSNCTDFQARRGAIRYREKAGDKTRLVHTLNGSSLALSRLMVAIMEVYQQEDGSVSIPSVLLKEGIF